MLVSLISDSLKERPPAALTGALLAVTAVLTGVSSFEGPTDSSVSLFVRSMTRVGDALGNPKADFAFMPYRSARIV